MIKIICDKCNRQIKGHIHEVSIKMPGDFDVFRDTMHFCEKCIDKIVDSIHRAKTRK